MSMTLAIIGGSGLSRMEGLSIERREMVKTPFGAPSCPLSFGTLGKAPVVYLARHGSAQRIPPHRINYCANLWALKSVGVTHILATSAVGGIVAECTPGTVVIPDQLIDYTQGRESSFSDASAENWHHVDFSQPYDDSLRQSLIKGASSSGAKACIDTGCYAAMQGPRFETAAEVRRLAAEGNTIVGMTGMPEAVLARELDIAYACCAVVVNRAAGLDGAQLDLENIKASTASGMLTVSEALTAAVATLQ
jgi:5'-methylthioinosine phosphorylase